MNALSNLWEKLSRSKKYRAAFVASELKRGIPRQIRALRKQREWTQADLASAAGLTQGVISRAEDPDYGNLTFNTILGIAAGFDVAFVGRFVKFSDLAKWHANLQDQPDLHVDNFAEDNEKFSRSQAVKVLMMPDKKGPTTATESALKLQEFTVTEDPAVMISIGELAG